MLRNNVGGATNYALQEAIGVYSDEAYTSAQKLSGTDIVAANPDIDVVGETYSGQLRWRKPITQVVNTASLTDATNGSLSSFATGYLEYIKTARTHGAEKVNLKTLVTQDDELQKFSRDLAETQAQDEHNGILSVLKGVAISEVLNGAGQAAGGTGLGGQTFTNDPTDSKYGFYVDLGNNPLVSASTAANMGAARAESFLQAFGMAYKDFEPDWAYLVTSPEVYASLRSANLVDQDRVQDGNIEFNTIFQGKFRLLQTRANQGLSTAQLTKVNSGSGVDIVGTKTSFIVLPGAVAMEHLSIENDVEIERSAASYQGGGTTQIWYRWGYVLHPAHYTWMGSKDKFVSDAEYAYAVESTVAKATTDVTNGLVATTGSWVRKCSSALSLGILPVFHG